jgi:hypothetical protein
MTEEQLFALAGKKLEPLPSKSLKPVSLPPLLVSPMPLYKVQFVIELVGASLLPGEGVRQLLERQTYRALGAPEIFVKIPGRVPWVLLHPLEDSLAYDSLAFAWDMVSPNGALSVSSAMELYRRTEAWAKIWERRAIPLPHPQEVGEVVQNLLNIRENLDFGLCFFASYPQGQDCLTLIERAYQLGFRMQAGGWLEWRLPGWEDALLEIKTIEGDGSFDLKARSHTQGLSIGFRVPCSPAPLEVFDRALETTLVLSKHGGEALTEDSEPLREENAWQYREWLKEAVQMLTHVGAEPGSREARRLFGCRGRM